MVSIQNSEKFTFYNDLQIYDHDPGVDTAVETPSTRLSMKDFSEVVVTAMATIPSGDGLQLLEIIASDAATSGTVVVIKTSGAIVADAVGDQATLSCTASEIVQAGTDAGIELEFITARLTMDGATDEAVVTIIRTEPRFAEAGLTPATRIA